MPSHTIVRSYNEIYMTSPCGIDRMFLTEKSYKLFDKLHKKKCATCMMAPRITTHFQTETKAEYGKKESKKEAISMMNNAEDMIQAIH
jgi:hypothetical protein